jgi:hypothetical protein
VTEYFVVHVRCTLSFFAPAAARPESSALPVSEIEKQVTPILGGRHLRPRVEGNSFVPSLNSGILITWLQRVFVNNIEPLQGFNKKSKNLHVSAVHPA